MGSLSYILNLLMITFSIFGIMLFIYDKFRINAAFLPILSVSVITLVIYIGGMIGLLPQTTFIMYVVGILCAVWEIVRLIRKKYSLIPFITSPGIIMFTLFCLFFIVRMRGFLVQHVDNFSHWATIIKEMCVTDSFPVPGTAITFRNYTPGSAVFMYYICKVIGFTEGNALMAQGFILSSALATIFCKVKLKNIVSIISLFITCVISVSIPELLSASLNIYNFLVDGLIAYISVAGGVIVYAYRRDLRRCLITLIPVIGMLTIIKSSARIFSALITVFVVLLFIRKIFCKGALRCPSTYFSIGGIAALVTSQLIFPSAWNIYITKIFPEHIDKFPSSADSLLSTFTSKDPLYLKDIASKMIAELTDPSSDSWLSVKIILIAECIAFAVLISACILRKKPGFIGTVFATTNLTGLFYIGELYILYGYIFDESEATILASFYRYFATEAVLIVFTLLAASIYQLKLMGDGSAKRVLSISLSAVMLASSTFGLYAVRDNAIQLIDPFHREETAARKIERLYFAEFFGEISDIVPPDSHLMVYTEKTSFFVKCLPQLELLTYHYSMLYPNAFADPSAVTSRIGKYNYIVVEGEFDKFLSNMTSVGYTVIGDDKALVYEVSAETSELIPVKAGS